MTSLLVIAAVVVVLAALLAVCGWEGGGRLWYVIGVGRRTVRVEAKVWRTIQETLAHDLREPLAAILALVELDQRRGMMASACAEQVAQRAEEALARVDALHALVRGASDRERKRQDIHGPRRRGLARGPRASRRSPPWQDEIAAGR